MTKTESTFQLKSSTIEICDYFSSKTENFINFQNNFLDESCNIQDHGNQDSDFIKKSSSSFLYDQEENAQTNKTSKSLSTLISDNEFIFSEIEKKSQIYHSTNYYHLIDKGELDQSDDQSNYRQSQLIDHIVKNRKTTQKNKDQLRLSYSCISLSKNSSNSSSIKDKSGSLIKKTFSDDTLSKRTSKLSNITVFESIRFYCLLKYRIKHLLKNKSI